MRKPKCTKNETDLKSGLDSVVGFIELLCRLPRCPQDHFPCLASPALTPPKGMTPLADQPLRRETVASLRFCARRSPPTAADCKTSPAKGSLNLRPLFDFRFTPAADQPTISER